MDEADALTIDDDIALILIYAFDSQGISNVTTCSSHVCVERSNYFTA